MPSLPRDGRSLFWPLQLGGWLAFAVAMALSRLGLFPLGFMVVSKAVLAALGLLTTLALRPLYRRLASRAGSPWLALAAALVASYLAALAWTAVYNVFYAAYWSAWFPEPQRITRLSHLFSGAVYHAFALFAWSVLYFGLKSYEALQLERERSLRAEAGAHEARLRALRYQLNPHFLFNTLNAISTLVVEERSREAAAMLARLSEFLRLTLDGGSAAEIPLAEEIEFVRRYLEIEQIRFGERLRVHVAVDDAALPVLVPALLLQPLVENAVRHAVAPREEGGRIEIEARRHGSGLLLRVVDDGGGLVAAPDAAGGAGRGIGLANTRERLRQCYGGDGRLELRDGADGAGGLEVRIEIPVREPVLPGAA